MPKTFRDAVFVARFLGVRYLWIDSLCIVQDDRDDWERESAQMSSIYKRAYLTIAALRAGSDSEGFLHPREPASARSCFAQGVHIYPAVENHCHYDDKWFGGIIAREPLSLRGWTLQERYLSRRMLSYGSQ